MKLGPVIFSLLFIALEVYALMAVFHTTKNGELGAKIFRWIFTVMCVYGLIFMFSMFLGIRPHGKPIYSYTGSLFAIWVGCLIGFCALLLIGDIVRFFSWLSKSSTTSWQDTSRLGFFYYGGAVLATIPFLAFIYGMLRNMYNFRKYKVKIPIANLPDDLVGLKIIQLSDIHSGTFINPRPIHKAVDLINEENADLILFTGDLVNFQADEVIPLMPAFKRLRAKFGVFSVLGNHDYGDYRMDNQDFDKEASLKQLCSYQKDMGWNLLRNENRIIEIGKSTLGLIGMENASGQKWFKKYGDLDKSYAGVEAADTKILMSHDPSFWRPNVLSKFKDIALTLSGHTHGMQFGIEIPGYIKWSPVKYFYKEWAGLYNVNDQSLYVNRGFGCLGYPGRVGILPEITVIELQRKS